MNLQEEMNKIDTFLNNLSVEEFDNILERCGINEISSGETDNKELLLSAKNTIEKRTYSRKHTYNDNYNLLFRKAGLNNKFNNKDQRKLIKAA